MLGFIVVFVLLGVLLIAAAVQKRFRKLQAPARGLLITYFTIALLLALGEGYFRFVYAESDGLPTLASQNWLARYWHTNTLGYRDPDWKPEALASRKTVLVVGDSFAAGWGIANPDDRFGNVLGKRLGDNYAVINLGKPGASTVEEIDDLQKYPLEKVDVVILQYYLNDIENAALSIGLDPKLDPTKGMPAWVNESYLANFVYWRLVARFEPQQEGSQTYWDWLYSMYDNSTVWAIHQKQLNQFADVVKQKGAKLIVVIFPNMLDPFHSVPYVDRVAQAFEAYGIESGAIVKLFDAAAVMDLSQRVVSARDAHASVAFNHEVGDMLYDKIVESLK
jgi:lysophospholipase L1-like esterase